jgi:hypothetical protein
MSATHIKGRQYNMRKGSNQENSRVISMAQKFCVYSKYQLSISSKQSKTNYKSPNFLWHTSGTEAYIEGE